MALDVLGGFRLYAPQIGRDWLGSYVYTEGPLIAEGIPKVHFKMRINPRWFWAISGTVEELEGGIPEAATISGSVRNGRIEFVKRYSALWVCEENGQMYRVPGQASAALRYRGEISENGHIIRGEWEIPPCSQVIGSSVVEFARTSGTWVAKLVQ